MCAVLALAGIAPGDRVALAGWARAGSRCSLIVRTYDCAQDACFAVLALRSRRLSGFQAGSHPFVAALSMRVRIARRAGHSIETIIQQLVSLFSHHCFVLALVARV